MPNKSLVVKHLWDPKRIDAYLAAALSSEFSRNQLKEALLKEKILVNGKPVKPRHLVQNGDLVEIKLEAEKPYKPEPEKTPLKIIYEDADLLVIDKPAGMVVHPGAGNKKGTLVNALLGAKLKLSSAGGDLRPGIVHRLDKDTSGLLLVAKNNRAHAALQAQFQERSLTKIYYALVRGSVEFEEGHIEEPIGHHPRIRQKMAVVRGEKGRVAETHYKVKQRFRYSTFLELKILTGRTHQIRVHLAHLGYPVLGDALYGTSSSEYTRQALHAAKIEFRHPRSGKLVKFESPIPKDFKEMLEKEEKK